MKLTYERDVTRARDAYRVMLHMVREVARSNLVRWEVSPHVLHLLRNWEGLITVAGIPIVQVKDAYTPIALVLDDPVPSDD